MHVHPLSLALAILVAYRGTRSGSLNTSGGLAAATLGYAALANPLSVFGVCLLGFYLAGSRATKVKAAIKATYEAPEDAAPSTSSSTPSKAKTGGNRNAVQVACNALIGTLCAASWRYLYGGELGGRSWEGEGRWCVVASEEEGGERVSRALMLAAVAFWASCCGDTFASELGILSSRPPILLTTLRPCPRGTNGGVSAWGTLVSLLGGVLVGLLAVVSLVVQGQAKTCGIGRLVEVVGVAALSGFGGSMLDSLLGALLQPTYYSQTRSLVVHSPHPSPAHPKEQIVRVPGSGWDVLSNNQVNFLSTAVVAGVVGWWASRG
ncbi:hypothetical protein NBRC10513v2_007670 [Rhodotorula toruloides]